VQQTPTEHVAEAPETVALAPSHRQPAPSGAQPNVEHWQLPPACEGYSAFAQQISVLLSGPQLGPLVVSAEAQAQNSAEGA
jgi:hypothetical protein